MHTLMHSRGVRELSPSSSRGFVTVELVFNTMYTLRQPLSCVQHVQPRNILRNISSSRQVAWPTSNGFNGAVNYSMGNSYNV